MTMDLGSLLSIIALIFVIAGHLCTTVWWMSKISVTLARLAEDVKDAVRDIKGLMPRTDCVKVHDHLEKQFENIWKKLDELSSK